MSWAADDHVISGTILTAYARSAPDAFAIRHGLWEQFTDVARDEGGHAWIGSQRTL